MGLSIADIKALPNYQMKNRVESSSACPECGGEDRFLFWNDKNNFYCRRCELKGFIGEDYNKLTNEQREELHRAALAVQRQASLERMKSRERLQLGGNDAMYHARSGEVLELYQSLYGINAESVATFKLGYSNACPTFKQSDSLTIPYYWRGELINLRHRLLQPDKGGKYRPEVAGLGTAIFNADRLGDSSEGHVVIVEGEFKAVVLEQNYIPTVAISGATQFQEKWCKLFKTNDVVFIALDPGVEAQARRIAGMLDREGVDARIVTLPDKPDDLFHHHGMGVGGFYRYLDQSRKVGE